MSMQSITVAIADTNCERKASLERSLQSEEGISVLADIASDANVISINRRIKSRSKISTIENAVARIRRLSPRILLANLNQSLDADCSLLVSLRRECPETLVVLLVDEPVREDQLMQVMINGARGYLDQKATPPSLSKAIHMVHRGEAWVPRRMLGEIMGEVLNWCHGNSAEASLDSAC